jgi:2-oxoglutarate ferredoxin oxidoreductase subunit gamma
MITRKVSRKNIEVIAVPANDVAAEVGEKRAANMVMLGAYIASTKVVPEETLLRGLEELFEKKFEFLEVNKRAFEKGLEYGGR